MGEWMYNCIDGWMMDGVDGCAHPFYIYNIQWRKGTARHDPVRVFWNDGRSAVRCGAVGACVSIEHLGKFSSTQINLQIFC